MNAAELAQLRTAFEPTFDTTAQIQRRTVVPDRSGGFNETWATVHTYPCSFITYPIRPLERESDVRIQSITTWLFHFASGSDVQTTDRILVGSRTFEVSGSGEGSKSLTLQVIAQEIL
jgi:hypothetical protein